MLSQFLILLSVSAGSSVFAENVAKPAQVETTLRVNSSSPKSAPVQFNNYDASQAKLREIFSKLPPFGPSQLAKLRFGKRWLCEDNQVITAKVMSNTDLTNENLPNRHLFMFAKRCEKPAPTAREHLEILNQGKHTQAKVFVFSDNGELMSNSVLDMYKSGKNKSFLRMTPDGLLIEEWTIPEKPVYVTRSQAIADPQQYTWKYSFCVPEDRLKAPLDQELRKAVEQTDAENHVACDEPQVS